MKNFLQDGNTITVTAPADVLSGAGVKVGAFLFGFAVFDALSGASLEIVRRGVFEKVPKDTSTIAIGDTLYWDNTAKKVTTTAGGNLKVGVAVTAAATGITTITIALVPQS